MAKILPIGFRRVAAAFDEVARARLCQSSGSEHSPESSTDLSDLVKSFLERDSTGGGDEEENDRDQTGMGNFWCDSEKIEMIKGFFGDENDCEKQRILVETEFACRLAGDWNSQSFKRRLMTHLRDRGFDAGLCKSRWQKTGRHPGGSYEYVDVNINNGSGRYIVEVHLAAQFEIARPTDGYVSLLELFPPIFIGKPEQLKQIVRLMSAAVKESMKSLDMHVPPWRRNGYMQLKWFGSYKRTTNAASITEKSKADETAKVVANRAMGFEALQVRPYLCRDDFAKRVGLKAGQLTAAFNEQ
ncbi:uncharacterized protein LOC123192489 [Mangifera indica]|uniref:uncharacterized protein LOC123192489 n=1 Tax=Mangifera indica TaxID=29780 RepID=UPI001CFAF751|nr:uncharacterized protein LOC123192489 [Mangifera indica]